jgi:peptide/nickel transport system substrate-binding protein
LEFKWQSTTAAMRVQYMQIFQNNLTGCGFKVNLENMAAGEFFADGPDGPVFGMHYDVGSFAWLTGVEPSCNLYLGSETPSDANGWAGQNNPGLQNEEFDAACTRAITALPAPRIRRGHKEAQRIFSEQLPVVPLFLRLKLAATRPESRGSSWSDQQLGNVEHRSLRSGSVRFM